MRVHVERPWPVKGLELEKLSRVYSGISRECAATRLQACRRCPCVLEVGSDFLPVIASQIKKEAQEEGDLGLVAQTATKAQRTLSFGQKIPPLSARDVR